MNKKNILITVLTVVLVAVCAAVAFIALKGNGGNQPTETKTTAISSTASAAGSVFNTTTTKKTTAKTTTKATTTEEKYPFIRTGCFYLADIEKEVCYAFKFNKSGNADVAFFDSDNIEGFDAQYSKGDGKYEIRNNKIVFSKLPAITGLANIEFEVKGSDLYYKGKKLRKFDKINLDNALKCFE